MFNPEINEKKELPKSKNCVELLHEFREKEAQEGKKEGEKLNFEGFPGKDIYNITAPFEVSGVTYILGRIESRNSHTDTQAAFFRETEDGSWALDENAPRFDWQDPFNAAINNETPIDTKEHSNQQGAELLEKYRAVQDPFGIKINDKFMVGGVETYPDPQIKGKLNYRTVIYRGKDLNNLEEFFQGPDEMKDIRIIKLEDGRIGVFTRPEELITKQNGDEIIKREIAFTTIESLDEIDKEKIDQAKINEKINKATIIEGLFADGEWGGANELHMLKNGKIGVLGHIACIDKNNYKHYYATTFVFDPKTGQASGIKIIATTDNFKEVEAKTPELKDVIFSGGLIRNSDGTADLYVGIGDAEAGKIKIEDPFLEYEQD